MKDEFVALFKSESDPLIMESMAIMFLGNFIFNSFDMQPLEKSSAQRQTELVQIINYMDENFKTNYNLSPHAYLVNQRINHAKQLLLEGKTVARTAVTCGFFDQSYFVKTFRQYVGIAPIDYK